MRLKHTKKINIFTGGIMGKTRASETPITSDRENNLNIIRFLSALMVIYGHMFSLVHANSQPVFLGQSIATIGVCIFFILSGYLVGLSYERDSNVLRYVIRRSFRIIPGLIMLVLITVFIIGPIFTTGSITEYFSSPLIGEYLRNMAFRISYILPNVFTANPYPQAVNGSLWSLPVEVLMYAFLPLLLFALKKFKYKDIVLAGVTILLIVLNYYPALGNITIYHVNILQALSIAPYFLIGYLFSVPQIKKILNLQVALFIFILFAFIQVPAEIGVLLAYIVIPYTVFSLGFATKPVFMKFGVKNDYSYGLFLYGFLSQQMLIDIFSIRMGAAVPFFIYLALSIGLSFAFALLSWHCVEKPMQQLSRRLLTKLSRRDSR